MKKLTRRRLERSLVRRSPVRRSPEKKRQARNLGKTFNQVNDAKQVSYNIRTLLWSHQYVKTLKVRKKSLKDPSYASPANMVIFFIQDKGYYHNLNLQVKISQPSNAF